MRASRNSQGLLNLGLRASKLSLLLIPWTKNKSCDQIHPEVHPAHSVLQERAGIQGEVKHWGQSFTHRLIKVLYYKCYKFGLSESQTQNCAYFSL